MWIELLVARIRSRFSRPQIGGEGQLDLASLQDALAKVDWSERPPREFRYFHRLLFKKEQIKLKMYQEPGHSRAHFHVDYGRNSHVAVYTVDTGERLEGSLDKAISTWTIANRKSLLAIWRALQSGEPEFSFVQSLSEFLQ
jgi:hypothetical protein